MDGERFQLLKQRFFEVRDLPRDERNLVLDRFGSNQPSLRDELERMLRIYDREKQHDQTRTTAHGSGSPKQVVRRTRPSIEGYEVLSEIHRGGQGIVYLATQHSTKRQVAIKVLLEGPYASTAARRRFEREIELVAQLKHPNIVVVFDSGLTPEGHLYCVMDHIQGVSLTRFARQEGLHLEAVLELCSDVCDAVSHAHQRGIIHRDLKPSNILVDGEGRPKLLDFGLAKIEGTTDPAVSFSAQVMGTLAYMSPEQTLGKPDLIDTRTDVYALGVILYEMLTGQLPYPASGPIAEAFKHIVETPAKPPSQVWTHDSGVSGESSGFLRSGQCPINEDTQTIVLKSLSKEPDRRYQSTDELARDLRRCLRGEAIEARRDSHWYVFTKMVHHRRGSLAAGAIIIALLAGLMGYMWNVRRAAHRVELAEETRQLGRAASAAGQTAQAAQYFAAAVELDPGNARAWANNAQVLLDQFKEITFTGADVELLHQADRCCKNSLAAGPSEDIVPAILNLNAIILYQAGRLTEAEAACRKALELRPAYPMAISNLAKILVLGRRFEEAIELIPPLAIDAEFKAASGGEGLYSDNPLRTMAALQLHLKQPEALTTLKLAVRVAKPPDARNHLLLARLRLDIEDHRDIDEALRQARLAEALRPVHDPRYKRILAMTHLRAGEESLALEYANSAIRDGDLPVFGHLIAAIISAENGDADAARQRLKEASKAWPTQESAPDGVIAGCQRELLWFDTVAEMEALRTEALEALAGQSEAPDAG